MVLASAALSFNPTSKEIMVQTEISAPCPQKQRHKAPFQNSAFWIARFFAEDISLRRFHTDGKRWKGIGQQIDKQKMHRLERDRKCCKRGVERTASIPAIFPESKNRIAFLIFL